jgi:hypothetical protein
MKGRISRYVASFAALGMAAGLIASGPLMAAGPTSRIC